MSAGKLPRWTRMTWIYRQYKIIEKNSYSRTVQYISKKRYIYYGTRYTFYNCARCVYQYVRKKLDRSYIRGRDNIGR
jgi:hypothetical protein